MNSKVLSKLNYKKDKQELLYQNAIREVSSTSNLVEAFHATLKSIEDDSSIHEMASLFFSSTESHFLKEAKLSADKKEIVFYTDKFFMDIPMNKYGTLSLGRRKPLSKPEMKKITHEEKMLKDVLKSYLDGKTPLKEMKKMFLSKFPPTGFTELLLLNMSKNYIHTKIENIYMGLAQKYSKTLDYLSDLDIYNYDVEEELEFIRGLDKLLKEFRNANVKIEMINLQKSEPLIFDIPICKEYSMLKS